MENFPPQRYETKIESFDSCMIEPTNQQPEITQTVSEQASSQTAPAQNREKYEYTSIIPEQIQTQQDQSDQIAQQNMTLTPVRLPAILDGEFFTVIRVEDTNVTVRCLQCQKHLNGNLKSTGNFLSHIKRVHPLTVEKIKCKSNQRKPAIVYIDLSPDKCAKHVRTKRGYRKCYKSEDNQPGQEDSDDQLPEWTETPLMRRRRQEESESGCQNNNALILEDEFDAIGRNVAAKLRSMRLDQRIIAEKLLSDILFEAQLGNLHRNSNIHV